METIAVAEPNPNQLPNQTKIVNVEQVQGIPEKKFLLGFDLYIKENLKFSSSILIISFLCISGIVLNTEPFLADI